MERITIEEQCNLAVKIANNPKALLLDIRYLVRAIVINSLPLNYN